MRAIGKLFRKFGYQKAGVHRRGFNAAGTNRLTNDWGDSGLSIDALLAGDLGKLRDRARKLARDNEYFQKFLTMLKCNVVGESGMTLKNKATEPARFEGGKLVPGKPDELANKLIEDAWWEWGRKENCTVAKDMTWLQVQQVMVEEFGTFGESLWEMVGGDAADNRFGFALKHISTERISAALNQALPNGNTIRQGVERNTNGAIVAYWITGGDPSESMFQRGNSYSAERFDARRFVRPYLRREGGQTRGYPIAAAAMFRMRMLAGYDEAVITGARAAACKMGFITKTGTGVEYSGPNAAEGGKYMDAEPGVLEELPQGMDIKTVDWNQPGSEYTPFTNQCLRGIASALGVSYPNLANDYSSVNFSSGRMARMEETEFWKFVQSSIIADFHEPIFSRWLEMALLSRAIKIDDEKMVLPASKFKKFNQPAFHGRRWGWVDPTKEVNAKESELANHITSPTRVLSELGLEEDEVLDEIQAYLEKVKMRGLPLPRWAVEQGGRQGQDGEDKGGEEPDLISGSKKLLPSDNYRVNYPRNGHLNGIENH